MLHKIIVLILRCDRIFPNNFAWILGWSLKYPTSLNISINVCAVVCCAVVCCAVVCCAVVCCAVFDDFLVMFFIVDLRMTIAIKFGVHLFPHH